MRNCFLFDGKKFIAMHVNDKTTLEQLSSSTFHMRLFDAFVNRLQNKKGVTLIQRFESVYNSRFIQSKGRKILGDLECCWRTSAVERHTNKSE